MYLYISRGSSLEQSQVQPFICDVVLEVYSEPWQTSGIKIATIK